MKVRLILDPPAHGAWNMAVDEALLASVSRGAPSAMRIYRWSEPTLSLGYFQRYADREQHPPSLSCPAVRRSSGGGAILHHREWTYSFTTPMTSNDATDRRRVYRCLHGALLETLRSCGVPAEIVESESPPRGGEPFLCFQRRSVGDVVVGPHKIGGSAQRRGKMAIMQHGSILLATSPAAPELPGIQEISGRMDLEELRARWLARVAQSLDIKWNQSPLSPEELRDATTLEADRHAKRAWILRR